MQVRDDISKRNVFISWTESDKEIKNKICKRLIKGGVTVLESKEGCSGDFEEWSKCAAVSASVFILILTENLIDKKTSYVKDEVREWRKATGDNFANRIIIVCPNYIITEKFVDENNQPVIGEDVKVSCIEYGENGVDDNVLNEIYNKTVMRIVGRMRAVYFTKSSKVSSIDISRMLGINQNDITYQFAEYNDLYITRTINCEGENYKEINSLLSKDDTKILFVTAPGGSGKSCYISQIFKELGQSDSDEDSLVFSISCVDASKELNKRKTEDKSDYSILLDILRKQFIKECGIGESYYTEENFLTLLNNSKKIVVVFDALDEVPNAGLVKKLAKAIVDLSKYGEDKIDIIITDRTDINRNLFRGAKIAKLNSFNDEDISQYCKSISRYLKNADLNEIIINDVDNAEVLEKINNTEDDVKRNPLMLTQILLLYAFTGEIKTGVVEILNSIVEIMFKSENRKELFGIDDKVPKNLLEILSAFAYERHICIVEGKKMSKKKVERIFDRLLNIKYVNLDQASLSELLKILFKSMARKFISVFGKIQQRVDGIGNLTKDIVRGEDLTDYLEYRSFYDAEKDAFCHARYGEYFVARYYCNAIFDEDGNIVNKDKLIELLSHCGNYYWKDIINYFVQLSGIAEIVIPENVTRLCGGLFSNCTKLKRVVLNKNIINIPEKAFYNCVSLEEVKAEGNITVETLMDDAFSCCIGVKKVVLSGSSKDIGESAFSGCSVNIGEGVESIGRLAFGECSSLKEIILSDSIKSIEYAAFSSCSSLEKVTLPSKLTEIADGLFNGCVSLKEINLPDSISSIGDYSFEGCTRLNEIVLPSTIYSIGNKAFYNCKALKSNIEKDILYNCRELQSIGDEAFGMCSSLIGISIPSGVTSIGTDAFKGCDSLEAVYIDNIVSWCRIGFKSEDSNPLSKAHNLYLCIKTFLNDANNLSLVYELLTELNLPDNIRDISSGAFIGCDSLESIVIPGSVRYIGAYAFYKCSNLKTVSILDGIINIKEGLFWKCSLLENIEIPDSVTVIEKYAFRECKSLKQVNFGENSRLESMGNGAFGECSLLENIEIPDSVTVIEKHAFRECKSLKQVNFGENSRLESIGESAFEECSLLGKVEIPENIRVIERFAFRICKSLKQVNFGENSRLENIGAEAFMCCSLLENIKIPERVTKICQGAFCRCENLKRVSIPDSVTVIEAFAFRECKSLKQVNFGENSRLENIGVGAFGECSLLENIEIPDSVTVIEAFVYRECKSLKQVELGKNSKLERINSNAFWGCEFLERITIPKSVKYVRADTFGKCSSLTIYCEAERQPAGWSSYWNPDNRPVFWGYKGD